MVFCRLVWTFFFLWFKAIFERRASDAGVLCPHFWWFLLFDFEELLWITLSFRRITRIVVKTTIFKVRRQPVVLMIQFFVENTNIAALFLFEQDDVGITNTLGDWAHSHNCIMSLLNIIRKPVEGALLHLQHRPCLLSGAKCKAIRWVTWIGVTPANTMTVRVRRLQSTRPTKHQN